MCNWAPSLTPTVSYFSSLHFIEALTRKTGVVYYKAWKKRNLFVSQCFFHPPHWLANMPSFHLCRKAMKEAKLNFPLCVLLVAGWPKQQQSSYRKRHCLQNRKKEKISRRERERDLPSGCGCIPHRRISPRHAHSEENSREGKY